MNARDQELLRAINEAAALDADLLPGLRLMPSDSQSAGERAIVQRQALLNIIERMLADRIKFQDECKDRLNGVLGTLEPLVDRLNGTLYELRR